LDVSAALPRKDCELVNYCGLRGFVRCGKSML